MAALRGLLPICGVKKSLVFLSEIFDLKKHWDSSIAKEKTECFQNHVIQNKCFVMKIL